MGLPMLVIAVRSCFDRLSTNGSFDHMLVITVRSCFDRLSTNGGLGSYRNGPYCLIERGHELVGE